MADFNIAINLKANDLGASQVIRGLTGNIRGLNSTIGRTSKRDLGQMLEGRAFQSAGRAVSRFGRAGRDAIGDVVETAAELEQSLANVRAVTSDARNIAFDPQARKNFEDLAGLARELGATTEFTAAEAADGLKFLGIAGLKTQEQLAALPPIIDLATAAETDLAKTSDFVSDIMGGFGIQADKTRATTDVLAKTFTESNTTLSFLSRSLFKVGPLAKTAGVGLTEMSAAAGFLGSQGIKGAEAGTVLRNSLLAMTGKPTKGAIAGLRAIGLTSKGLKKTLEEQGFEGAFLKISAGLSKLKGTKQLGVAEAIFGKRTASAAAALSEGFKTGELVKFRQELEKSGGTTRDVATIMRDTAVNKMKLFESAMDGLKVQLGEEFIPILKDMLPDILDLAKSFAAWLKENKELLPTMAKAALGMTAIATVAGPLLSAVGLLKVTMGGLGISTRLAGTAASLAAPGFAALSATMLGSAGLVGLAAAAGIGIGLLLNKLGASDAVEELTADLTGLNSQLATLNALSGGTTQGRGGITLLGDLSETDRTELQSLRKQKSAKARQLGNLGVFEDDDALKAELASLDRKIIALNKKGLEVGNARRSAQAGVIDLGPGRGSKLGDSERAPTQDAKVKLDVRVKVDQEGRAIGATVEQRSDAGQFTEGL